MSWQDGTILKQSILIPVSLDGIQQLTPLNQTVPGNHMDQVSRERHRCTSRNTVPSLRDAMRQSVGGPGVNAPGGLPKIIPFATLNFMTLSSFCFMCSKPLHKSHQFNGHVAIIANEYNKICEISRRARNTNSHALRLSVICHARLFT